MSYTFFVGTYANFLQESILRYTVDFESGAFNREASHTGTVNPSWLLLNRSKSILYSVSETSPAGGLCAFDLSQGEIRTICRLPSLGADPCHLELSEDGSLLFISNYSSGTLAVYLLAPSGIPVQLACVRRHTGLSGPGRDFVAQEGPHIHFSRCLGKTLLISDLGLDAVFFCRLLSGGALEDTEPPLRLPDGSGPRHLCLRADEREWLYVVGELCSQIFVFHREASGYRYRQSLSTLPDGFSGPNICAAVKWSEDMQHLFVSNRGHDSIAVFAVCRDHLLHRTDICRTGGRMPRDFGVFGSHLVVANQESRSLTVLTFDPAAGTLRQTSLCEELSAKPVCILPF